MEEEMHPKELFYLLFLSIVIFLCMLSVQIAIKAMISKLLMRI